MVSASAANVDPNLVNAWGIARGSSSPWWISDNGTGLSTLYDATGKAQSLVVKIPTPDGTGTSAPTGTVFNATTSFLVGPSAKAIFSVCDRGRNNFRVEPDGEPHQCDSVEEPCRQGDL
jgi:hypothetical protein